jgi:ribose-phosphate pyrophosphokinase
MRPAPPRTRVQGGRADGGPCRVHTFADSAPFARHLARLLGISCATVRLHRFPDGESLVRVRQPVATHAILVRALHDPNAKLLETVLAGDALYRAGARRVTLVAPYLPYMRQDTVFAPGEPVSQRVVGAWLGASFDALYTIETHLHRVRTLGAVVPGRAASLSAAPALAEWLQTTADDTCIVGPDVESDPWVRRIAQLAQRPWLVCRKQRLGDRAVRVHLPARPAGRRAVIVDDIASSGATLAATARALRRAGVRVVDAAVVHALFEPGALGRIRRAGVRRIVSSDTIPHATNAVRTAPLLLSVLRPQVR